MSFSLPKHSLGVLTASLILSACATTIVVGTAAKVGKVAVKTTVGAGKLAYRGTKAVAKGTSRLLTDDEEATPSQDQ